MRDGTRCFAFYHNILNDLPRRLATHATTTFKYFLWKALDACFQRSAIVHISAPKHRREEEVGVHLLTTGSPRCRVIQMVHYLSRM